MSISERNANVDSLKTQSHNTWVKILRKHVNLRELKEVYLAYHHFHPSVIHAWKTHEVQGNKNISNAFPRTDDVPIGDKVGFDDANKEGYRKKFNEARYFNLPIMSFEKIDQWIKHDFTDA